MKLIFADNASVLPGRFELWSGTKEDVYRFKRKWIVPCEPKLEMDMGEPALDWSTVAKLFEGISWNLHMTLRLRNTTDATSQAANIFVEANEGFCELNKFRLLFQGQGVNMKVKIATGEARCVTIQTGVWHGSDNNVVGCSEENYEYDVKLTVEEVFHLLMTNDNDVRISYAFWIDLRNKDHSAGALRKKIFETGYFADLEVVSKEGTVIPCHRVFLPEGGGLRKKFEDGARKFKFNVSGRVLRVLFGYLYHGELDQIKDDLELAVEVLNENRSYNIPNLWRKLTQILMDQDFDTKVAFDVFSILVKAGKVDDFEDLARKLVAVIHLYGIPT